MALAKRESTRYDVNVGGDLAAGKMATCISQKAFCIVNMDVDKALLKSALTEVEELEEATPTRFEVPPRDVVGGLLGEEGSSEICQLDTGSDTPSEGAGLQAADAVLTTVAKLLIPMDSGMGMRIESRSFGLLHKAGVPSDDEVPLTEMACQRWLKHFVKHRLMVVLILGPVGGSMEMQPFGHEDAPPVEVALEPGSVLILRADTLSHKYTSIGKSYTLSCWLSQETLDGLRKEPICLTPTTDELMTWAMQKLGEHKMNQVIGDEGQEPWDPIVPKEWQMAANKAFHFGKQVAINGYACKLPSTWLVPDFWRAHCFGVDWCVEVPFGRWNHEDWYDPNPESWKYFKTSTKHGSFFEGWELWDNKFFGISVAEGRGMIPEQRHILETSYECLHMGGETRKSLMRSLIGTYIGAAASEFTFAPVAPDFQGGACGSNSITSNRINYCLGMQGPSYTVDAEGASGVFCIGAAAMSMRHKTESVDPNRSAVAGGVFMLFAGNPFVLLSATGILSAQGRCFSFDASAEGIVRGEGCGNVLMNAMTRQVDGQEVVDDNLNIEGIISANASSHSGRAASLTAPSGPQERAVILDAVRQAGITPSDVEILEAYGKATMLHDSVEASAASAALRSDDASTPLGLSTGKTNRGQSNEADGIAACLKVIMGLRYGNQVPGLHLSELNVHIDAWSGDEALLFNTENMTSVSTCSYAGITGHSVGGILAHCLALGFVDPQRRPPRASVKHETIAFWPEGGGELPAEAEPQSSTRPYMIVGSWADWSSPEKMEHEGSGVYGYSVTLGDSRFEQFQLLLDGEEDKVLHPSFPEASTGSALTGPTKPEDSYGLCWLLDGRDRPHIAVKPTGPEAGGYNLLQASLVCSTQDDDTMPFSVAELAADGPDTKGAVQNLAAGMPGDKYRVRLHVDGKWRMVDWEKL